MLVVRPQFFVAPPTSSEIAGDLWEVTMQIDIDVLEAKLRVTMRQIRCTVPACTVTGLPERMWLPELAALRRANGERTVALEDLPKFALCGKHGRFLRQEKVRVYRFDASVKLVEKRVGERLMFRPFAEKFLPKKPRTLA